MSGFGGQDWEPVVLRKGPAPGSGPQGPKGGTSRMTSAGVDIRHLEDDDSDAPMKLPTASLDLRIAIAQARQGQAVEVSPGGKEETFIRNPRLQGSQHTAKNLSQKELGAKLMIPAKTIQDYEAGKAIPNNGLIAKMERALGCKLPRVPKAK